MNKILKKYKQAKVIGLKITFKKVFNKFNFIRNNKKFQKFYLNSDITFINIKYNNNLSNNLLKKNDLILDITNNLLSFHFNMLGSGWVKNLLTSETRDFQNIKFDTKLSLEESKKFLKQIITLNNLCLESELNEFDLIDWQKDFRCGYRWDFQPSTSLKYGNIEGADIKIPWEFGRMQFLPYLSLVSEIDEISAKKHIEFIINFINSFSKYNPFGYGVQWLSPMDAGIRIVSIFITIELAKRNRNQIIKSINLESLVKTHINFLLKNLEWSSGMRGNHYLSNICSLVIVSSYFLGHKEFNNIFQFSIIELNNELYYQFNKDGSNFEASLAYHMFAFEMVLIAFTFLKENIAKLPDFSLSNQYFDYKNQRIIKNNYKLDELLNSLQQRINEIGKFSLNILLSDYSVPLIGDNDSGRYFKLVPKFNKNFDYEITNNWKDLISYFLSQNYTFDSLINHYLNPVNINISKSNYLSSDFGIYKITNNKYDFIFRAGSIGQNGKGGHSHNDQLSFCFFINDNPIIVDVGTFTYTAFPQKRNLFRGTNYHNTLSIKNFEQNIFFQNDKNDLFWLFEKTKSNINFTSNKIISEHFGFNKKYRRVINFNDNVIYFNELLELPLQKQINIHLHPNTFIKFNENTIELINNNKKCIIKFDNAEIKVEKSYYSPEYGTLIETKVIRLIFLNNEFNWEIRIINDIDN